MLRGSVACHNILHSLGWHDSLSPKAFLLGSSQAVHEEPVILCLSLVKSNWTHRATANPAAHFHGWCELDQNGYSYNPYRYLPVDHSTRPDPALITTISLSTILLEATTMWLKSTEINYLSSLDLTTFPVIFKNVLYACGVCICEDAYSMYTCKGQRSLVSCFISSALFPWDRVFLWI